MKYLFEGAVIKLNEKDYNDMQKLYPNIDLGLELKQLDMELRDKKSWWMPLQAKLNYRNKNVKGVKKGDAFDRLQDRDWSTGLVDEDTTVITQDKYIQN